MSLREISTEWGVADILSRNLLESKIEKEKLCFGPMQGVVGRGEGEG